MKIKFYNCMKYLQSQQFKNTFTKKKLLKILESKGVISIN